MLGARHARRVVGERGARKLVGGESLGHRTPALHARARVGFGEGPQVPRPSVPVVDRLGTLGELAHDVGATSREPVGVRQHDHRLGVRRRRLDDALVHRDHDLGKIHVRRRGGAERLGGSLAHGRLDAVEERADVAVLAIVVDGCLECGGDVVRGG